jgi:hypothetical protein
LLGSKCPRNELGMICPNEAVTRTLLGLLS